jgi:hypothetical protein
LANWLGTATVLGLSTAKTPQAKTFVVADGAREIANSDPETHVWHGSGVDAIFLLAARIDVAEIGRPDRPAWRRQGSLLPSHSARADLLVSRNNAEITPGARAQRARTLRLL